MGNRNLPESDKLTIAPHFNSFVWFPPKSSSSLVSWIFTYFDFRPYRVNPETNEAEFDPPIVTHFGHTYNYPPNSRQMNFIITLRNPYERLFSFFKMQKYSYWTIKLKQPIPTKEDFENFFYKNFLQDKIQLDRIVPKFDEGLPNCIIHRETLLEDLLKIDFIRDSKLNSSGILSEMCSRKINSSPYLPIEDYMTEEIKEQIYEIFKVEFEIGGYSK